MRRHGDPRLGLAILVLCAISPVAEAHKSRPAKTLPVPAEFKRLIIVQGDAGFVIRTGSSSLPSTVSTPASQVPLGHAVRLDRRILETSSQAKDSENDRIH